MSKPKISLNKLGEYLQATPARRKRIVQDQKNPEPFIVTRYADARESIVDYLVSGMLDDAKLLSDAHELRHSQEDTDFKRQDKKLSAEAIEQFLEIADSIDVDDLIVEAVPYTARITTEIAGVEVSIRPEVLLKDPDTKEIVGAIKCHFSKSYSFGAKYAGHVATALKIGIEENYPNTNMQVKKCYVVDVPEQRVTYASKAFVRNMNDLQSACEEFSMRWIMEDNKSAN